MFYCKMYFIEGEIMEQLDIEDFTEWTKQPQCFLCSKEILDTQSYFSGTICPPVITGKFGCAPYYNYCIDCMKNLSKYFCNSSKEENKL